MIGKRISEFRKRKNLTQTELADAMGVSFQAVSNWERGNSMPDISKLADLTEILGTTIDELLGKKNSAVERLAKNEEIYIEDFRIEEIEEAAEIAKPRILEQMAENSNDENLAPLLPYLSEEYLAEAATKKYKEGKDIKAFLPFLSEDALYGLIVQAISDGRTDINRLLPFASEETVEKLILQSVDDGGTDIKQLLPFASEETVAKAAKRYKETGKEIPVFQPYLNEDEVKKFALEILVEELIKKGILTPPENGTGAEGIWMSVE